MTRVCVFSDSHGCPDHMLRVIREEEPDVVFHLGDGERDVAAVRRAFPGLTVHAVRGNCDWSGPALIQTRIEGQKVFAAHGDAYRVKSDRDYQTLRYAALEADARLVLFGHTHRPYHDRVWGMELVNPGSVGYGPYASYALVTIDGEKITAQLRPASGRNFRG